MSGWKNNRSTDKENAFAELSSVLLFPANWARLLPQSPEPCKKFVGNRITGTPPFVYSTSMKPFEPTTHCWHVRTLSNNIKRGNKTSQTEMLTWSSPYQTDKVIEKQCGYHSGAI